jgi:hypothetical protein
MQSFEELHLHRLRRLHAAALVLQHDEAVRLPTSERSTPEPC